MAILSKIWEFFLGTSAEKGSVDGASKHPLDALAGMEERRVEPVKEKPTTTRKTTGTKKPAAPKPKATTAGAKKTTKTKGTSKTNGNVRHQRKDSRAGK